MADSHPAVVGVGSPGGVIEICPRASRARGVAAFSGYNALFSELLFVLRLRRVVYQSGLHGPGNCLSFGNIKTHDCRSRVRKYIATSV